MVNGKTRSPVFQTLEDQCKIWYRECHCTYIVSVSWDPVLFSQQTHLTCSVKKTKQLPPYLIGHSKFLSITESSDKWHFVRTENTLCATSTSTSLLFQSGRGGVVY